MSKLYKNAPLTEVGLEIRFPSDLSIESRRGEFHKKIRKDYPHLFVPKAIAGEAPALQRYRFMSEDRIRRMHFSINRFSFHTTKYEGFPEFEEESLIYLRLFCKTYDISELNRIGLRYVNLIPIQSEDGVIQISKYLKFGYKLPQAIPNKIELFDTTLLIGLNQGKLRILVQYQEREGSDTRENILLDFDYFVEGKFKTEELQNCIAQAHQHTKRVFENLIADEYRAIMEES